MKITEDIVAHIAHLARLEFKGENKEAITEDLERITTFMGKLQEIDTDGVEPLIYMTNEMNHLREDIVKESVSHEDALKNAPKKDSDYFRIPKVLSK